MSITSQLAPSSPTSVLSSLELLAQEGGERIFSSIVKFIEIVRVWLSVSAPMCAAEVLDREIKLHRQVAKECLDPIFGAMLQNAHNSPHVLDQADVIARRERFAPQRAQVGVQVRLLGGSSVELNTPYYLRRSGGDHNPKQLGLREQTSNGLYPVLSMLGIHHRVSPALGSEVARLVAQGVQREAIENLAVRGIHLNLKVVQRVVKAISKRALRYRYIGAGWNASSPNANGKRIAVAIDGGRIRLRENDANEPLEKSGRRGFKPEWREPKLFVVYELDADGKREAKGVVRYDATLEDADAVCFSYLADVLSGLGIENAREIVFLGDGAAWIWNRFKTFAEICKKEGVKVTQVVDFYHAVEHLQSIADEVRGWKGDEKINWVKKNKQHLRAGQIELLVANCNALCRGRKAKAIRKMISYFTTHANRMRYSDFEKEKLPIGSGAVESAIRRIVNLRLKGNGIFWTREAAEGLLHLRSQLLSGRWEEFIKAIFEPPCRW